ncbi:MAG TPA: 50S ribosomal protein L21 [Gemmatimonadota bacterium]|nr:50S ribosomal protein L21 [Gemmatimonadota bacterium]
MRAIIETGGKQFAVAPNQTIRVPSLAGDPGDKVTFDRVLYAAGSDAVHVGAPHVQGASVTAEIVKHGRGKKIVVFKYKRRKRYSRKKGHRQGFTELRVTGVDVSGGRKSEKRDAAPAGESAAEIFVCDECGKEYKTERGLQQHAAREHAKTK